MCSKSMDIYFLINVDLPSLVDSTTLTLGISDASMSNEFKIDCCFVLLIVLFSFYGLVFLYLSMASMFYF